VEKKMKASISKNQSPVGVGIMFFEIPALCGQEGAGITFF
jgi:hypothetical protein